MWWVLLALLQALPQIPERDPAPAASATAVLRGRVTDKYTGQPLSGIVVKINGSRPGQPAIETRTDADGVYQLTGVPAGSHYLVAQMPDYRLTHLPMAYGDTGPPRTMWASGAPPKLDVAAGETRSGVDFALTPTMAFSGRVVDESGIPLTNVRIRLDLMASPSTATARVGETDDRGEFRAFGLAPGRYRVCADPATFVYTDRVPPDAPATACYPASGRAQDALVVAEREPAPIAITMRRGATVTVAGTVVDASGALAEGAAVTLGRRGAGFPTTYALPIWPGAQFSARGLSPGRYYLAVSGGTSVDTGRIERQYAYVPIDVGSSDLTGMMIRLSRPATVSGRLIVDDGAPLPTGSRLTVQAHLDGPLASALNRTVPTGLVRDDMSFELPGVLGAITIRCEGLPQGWVVKAIRYAGEDVTAHAFTPAGDAPSVDLVVSSRGAIASGTVLDEQGVKPVARAIVWMFPVDSSAWSADRASYAAIASGEGRFTQPTVAAGDYFLAAVEWAASEGETLLRARLERLARVAQRITLGEGERRTIELRVVKLSEGR